MPTPLRILTFAFGISLACGVYAAQPRYNFSDKTVAELLELLESKDSTIRDCAAIFLGDRYRNPKVTVINAPIHKPNSPPPDARVRIDVLSVLADFEAHAHEIIPFMLNGLRDQDPWVRLCAAHGLGRFAKEPEVAVPGLIQVLLEDKDDRPRRTAAEALGYFREQGKPAIPALLRALKDKDPDLRERAGTSLWLIDGQAAAKAGVDVFRSYP
jgi:HEAT repeat protein